MARRLTFLRVDQPPAGERVLDEHVARSLVHMLESVSARGHRRPRRGSGLPGGGQDRHRMESEAGGYSTDKYMSVFGGVVPASAPRLAVPRVGNKAFVLSPRGVATASVRAAGDQPGGRDHGVRLHVPDLRRPRVRVGRRPVRRRTRGPLASGPGRIRRMRHAAGRRARRHGQFRSSAAGYYVVIDGKGTGADNAYMHCASAPTCWSATTSTPVRRW